MRITDAIERILASMPERIEGGCDRVIHGDPSAELRGIAATFLATHEGLERAAAAGCNLVVTHEPTFYNHHDHTAWLGDEPVHRAKRALIEAKGLVVWRLHDHVHRGWPDAIATGMLRALGWNGREDPAVRSRVRLAPGTTLGSLVTDIKGRLGIAVVRVVGDLAEPCVSVVLLPGVCGGQRQIEQLSLPDAEVVVCGESAEWETCEYVRDARAGGRRKALIVLGHANSEEAGMEAVGADIRALFPGTPYAWLPTGDPFVMV